MGVGGIMKYDDRIKYMLSGYFGIKEISNYERKLFVLKDVERYIKEYLKTNKVDGVNYYELAETIEKNTLREKIQDSLIVLNEINGPIDLILLIKLKIKELKYNDK